VAGSPSSLVQAAVLPARQPTARCSLLPVTAIFWAGGLVLLSVVFWTGAAVASSRRRGAQAAGREAALAWEAAASWPVRIKPDSPLRIHGPGMDAGRVTLRGDFIEVTPAARMFNGREYYFPAREAWLHIEDGSFGREWVVITGISSGKPAFVSVCAGNRGATEGLWRALTAAGARAERPAG
jgi:hypothetical protein